MNAIEWAEYFERTCRYTAVADILCKQDAAIKQLREALEFVDSHIPNVGSVSHAIKAALTATEEFSK